MKKLLLIIALLLLPLSASASQGDALLAPDGTLYSIEVLTTDASDVTTAADTRLMLTSRHGSEVITEVVPATSSQGSHMTPAMAFDADTGALFVFWLHRKSLWGSELLFAIRSREGVWSEPTPFGGSLFHDRENLRIAVTRKYFEDDVLQPGISVHAVWSEFDTYDGEWFAQYQMLTIVNGAVAEASPLDLRQFAREVEAAPSAEPVPADVLRHPLLFPSPKQESVVVVFGDMATQQMHEVRIRPMKPKDDGRLRVPVGRREGSIGAAPKLAVANGRMDGVYADSDRMALYSKDAGVMRYVVMKNGVWSEPQHIALDDKVTPAAAVDALRRLVNEQ